MKFDFLQKREVWRRLRSRGGYFIIGFIGFVTLSLTGFKFSPESIAAKPGLANILSVKPNLEISRAVVVSTQQPKPAPMRQNFRPIEQIVAQQPSTPNIWQRASFPVENFQAYTSAFGFRDSPIGSTSNEFHYGLDIAAPEGSYVRNWWDGQVIEVSDHTSCGTSAIIQSGQWTHTYCHMSGSVETIAGQPHLVDSEGGIQLAQGQMIPAGFRIGRVGMTGRTTGPHLHWTLKYGSDWVDPGLVLQKMFAAQQTS